MFQAAQAKVSTKQGPVKLFFANKNLSEIEPARVHWMEVVS
jgi:hypothetical protein